MKLIANETKVCEREKQRYNALQFSLTEKKRKREKPKLNKARRNFYDKKSDINKPNALLEASS